MNSLERIEHKLDLIDAKLDDHLERLAKAEASIGWLKYGFSLMISLLGATGLAVGKFI